MRNTAQKSSTALWSLLLWFLMQTTSNRNESSGGFSESIEYGNVLSVFRIVGQRQRLPKQEARARRLPIRSEVVHLAQQPCDYKLLSINLVLQLLHSYFGRNLEFFKFIHSGEVVKLNRSK